VLIRTLTVSGICYYLLLKKKLFVYYKFLLKLCI